MWTAFAYVVSLFAWVSYRLMAIVASYGPLRSNCDLAAMTRQQRQGGYVVLMPSLWYSWPHAVWTRDFRTFEQFVPADGVQGPRRIPPVLFQGEWTVWTPEMWDAAVLRKARLVRLQHRRQHRKRRSSGA
jgi:hypothetical protein